MKIQISKRFSHGSISEKPGCDIIDVNVVNVGYL